MRSSRLWLAAPVAAGLFGLLPASASADPPPPAEVHVQILRIDELLQGHIVMGLLGAQGQVDVPPTLTSVLDWVQEQVAALLGGAPLPSS